MQEEENLLKIKCQEYILLTNCVISSVIISYDFISAYILLYCFQILYLKYLHIC